MTRSTIVILDKDSATCLSEGIQEAIKDRHDIARVRMASSVHGSIVKAAQFGLPEDDKALKALQLTFDPNVRAGLQHGDECGTLYGKPVFLDDTLKARCLIIESEPWPEEQQQ